MKEIGAMTREEAFTLSRDKKVHTGGCWGCIHESRIKTQYQLSEMKQISHAFFCKDHYEKYLRGLPQ